MQSYLKAAAVASLAFSMQGCNEDKKEVKTQQPVKVLRGLDSDKIESGIRNTIADALKAVQFKAIAQQGINAASNVVAKHTDVEKYVRDAFDTLFATDKPANELVEKAYHQLHTQLKNLPDVNVADEKAKEWYQFVIDEGHKKVVEALKNVHANKESIDKQAETLEKYIREQTGINIDAHNAVANGLNIMTQLVANGRGLASDARDYADSIQLKNHMVSKIAAALFGGKNIDEIESDIRKKVGSAADAVEDELSEFQKNAKKIMKDRVKYIEQTKDTASKVVNQAQEVVDSLSKTVKK
jgi:hypothetical protein